MNEILKINSITKSFPRVIANKDVSFSIKKNSVHALLGENGAGKSTLVKILFISYPSQKKLISRACPMGTIRSMPLVQFFFIKVSNFSFFKNLYSFFCS